MSATDTEARTCTITVPPTAKNGDKLKLTIPGQKERVIVTLKDAKPGESITILLPERGKAGRAWLTEVPEKTDCSRNKIQEDYVDTPENIALSVAEAALARARTARALSTAQLPSLIVTSPPAKEEISTPYSAAHKYLSARFEEIGDDLCT